jgi:DNA-binding NtrC family response regulator
VLIVDDNIALAENLAEILELEGYGTEVAASAEEALPKALAGDHVVVVTDFRLPGMDGAELVSHVRRVRAHLRCIVISAFTDESTVRRAQEAGARFLPKPVDLVRLSSLVEESRGS